MFSERWLDVKQQWKNSIDGFILPFVFAQLLLTEETNSDKFKFYVKKYPFLPIFSIGYGRIKANHMRKS